MPNVLMPIPSQGFDPTETAIPWRILTASGIPVTVSTPDGRPGSPDPRMVTGQGLAIWAPILKADARGREAFRALDSSVEFRSPRRWSELRVDDFGALLLPGGHAAGMREYLESEKLQRLTVDFFRAGKPVAAICHGVVLAARSRDPETGRSVLHGRKTTSLLSTQERTAWLMTAAWLGRYYRTYPETVQDEVTRALAAPTDFAAGPTPVFRDSPARLDRGFTLRDGNYLSARWPGDAHRFGREFAAMLGAVPV